MAGVVKTKSDVQINLSSLLRRANLEVESDYSEQFSAALERQTPVGIAVVVDMTVAEKRKMNARKARRIKATENLNANGTN